jgi:hypothetical protein
LVASKVHAPKGERGFLWVQARAMACVGLSAEAARLGPVPASEYTQVTTAARRTTWRLARRITAHHPPARVVGAQSEQNNKHHGQRTNRDLGSCNASRVEPTIDQRAGQHISLALTRRSRVIGSGTAELSRWKSISFSMGFDDEPVEGWSGFTVSVRSPSTAVSGSGERGLCLRVTGREPPPEDYVRDSLGHCHDRGLWVC